jgi:Cytochrome c2
MTRRRILHAALVALPLAGAGLPALAAGDAAHGASVYRSLCSGCHDLDENRVGPAHRGVFGRKAGARPTTAILRPWLRRASYGRRKRSTGG